MTAVATELGLTQSAVSHAVGRLRAFFDDPLFVRKGAGVEPTSRALQIGPMLSEALTSVRNAAQVGRSFDPASSARRFTIAAPDTVVTALAPTVLNQLMKTAPRCQVIFSSFSHRSAEAAVVDQEADIALGVFHAPVAETVSVQIATETFGVISRQGHPEIGDALDLDTYCGLGHLLVSQDPDARGAVDSFLNGLNRTRRIVAYMPHLMLGFAAASQSDVIMTAPLSACRYAASLMPVTVHTPPFTLPALELSMLRHRDGLADPAISWLARLVHDALAH